MTGEYAPTNRVEYLSNFPGARIETDLIAATIEGGEVDITDRAQRSLGKVSLIDAPTLDTDLAVALDANDRLQVVSQGTTTVTDDGAFNATVTDDGSFNIAGTATVTDDGSFSATVEGQNDEAFENGTALASGGTTTTSFSAPDAERVVGRVSRASTSYGVSIDWKDSNGNVLFTTDVASDVAAGTETPIDEKLVSPYFDVKVSDAGSASGAVTAALYTR